MDNEARRDHEYQEDDRADAVSARYAKVWHAAIAPVTFIACAARVMPGTANDVGGQHGGPVEVWLDHHCMNTGTTTSSS